MTALLEMHGISKTFPGVRALDQVNLMVDAGEIHAICRRERRGQIHADEGAVRGLSAWQATTARSAMTGGVLENRSIRDS